MKRIAIQGRSGSYHDLAAHQYFDGEQLQIICCATFEDVFAEMEKDPAIIGMIAIENPREETVLVVSENGYGKRSYIDDPETPE